MPYDPDYANCKLLLHANGTNGSTVIIDSSSFPKTVTLGGNTQLSTTQKKMGSASILLDGSSDYFQVPDSDDWEPTTDYTVAMWIRPTTVLGGARYLASRQTAGTPTSWVLLQNNAAISLYLSFNNSTWTGNPACTGGTLSINTWHHVAWTRSGNNYRLFLDGVQVGSTYTNASSFTNASTVLRFGSNTASQYEFVGNMDEIAIWKGVAKWTENFTPPTSEWTDVMSLNGIKQVISY